MGRAEISRRIPSFTPSMTTIMFHWIDFAGGDILIFVQVIMLVKHLAIIDGLFFFGVMFSIKNGKSIV